MPMIHRDMKYTEAHVRMAGTKKVATVTGKTYSDPNRIEGKTYYYKVRSILAANQYSNYSDVKTGVPLGNVKALYVKIQNFRRRYGKMGKKSSWCNKVYCNEKTVRSSKLSADRNNRG